MYIQLKSLYEACEARCEVKIIFTKLTINISREPYQYEFVEQSNEENVNKKYDISSYNSYKDHHNVDVCVFEMLVTPKRSLPFILLVNRKSFRIISGFVSIVMGYKSSQTPLIKAGTLTNGYYNSFLRGYFSTYIPCNQTACGIFFSNTSIG
ncbi:hypothetical protein K501DRAFT_272699 [Backusella circina FSU 941]|nr:hypothetical protein K501DRAFT_272699 [Backusella circina FSU 941]